jgi:uncharacterized protein YjaG (DUF416 family)
MENAEVPDPSYETMYGLLPELAKLRDALSRLSARHQLAFALCCCERLYPSYQAFVAFHQVQDRIRPILDRLWQHVLGHEMTEMEISQGLTTCRPPSFDNGKTCPPSDEACDALIATHVTLEACRQYSLDNVVRAAEQVRNQVDRPLWKELAKEKVEGIGPDELTHIEETIRSHPTMVAEIKMEAAQLKFLYECEELTDTHIRQLLSYQTD